MKYVFLFLNNLTIMLLAARRVFTSLNKYSSNLN